MKSHRKTLIFGLAELIPSELSPAEATKEQLYTGPIRGRRDRVWMERFPVTVEQGLNWYSTCRQGNVSLPVEDAPSPDVIKLEHGPLVQEPQWPHLEATKSAPFLSNGWGTVRAHHLFQQVRSDDLDLVMKNDKAVAWITERLSFDLSDYDEWAGSVSLIAPNPIYRELDCRRELSTEWHDSTVVRIVARAGQPLDTLRIDLREEGPDGLLVQSVDVTDPVMSIPHAGALLASSFSVMCKQRGLLDWSELGPYINQMAIRQEATGRDKPVDVPPVRKRQGEQYSRNVVENTTEILIKGEVPIDTAIEPLQQARARRLLRERNQDRVEKFFHDEQDVATAFIRDLVRKARSDIHFIDRYFDATEFVRYALAIEVRNITVTIITSAECMRDKEPGQPGRTRAKALRDAIETHQAKGRFDVLVMPRDPPAIHDRFLIIGGDVFLVGNSFHSLGQRAGMVVKLAQPKPAIRRIEGIVRAEAFQTLDDWMRDNPLSAPAKDAAVESVAESNVVADENRGQGESRT